MPTSDDFNLSALSNVEAAAIDELPLPRLKAAPPWYLGYFQIGID
jgi:hypothetical protein